MSFNLSHSIKRFFEALIHGPLYMRFEDPGTFVYLGTIKSKMNENPDFRNYVNHCIKRFFNKDWPPERICGNRFEAAEAGDLVVSKYESDVYGDIAIYKCPHLRGTLVFIIGDKTVDTSEENLERIRRENLRKK